MNPDVEAAIEAINDYIITNGNQEITAAILNPILLQIINSLYDITGNNEDLSTDDKSNLVAAINELKESINDLDPISLYNGGDDPNVTPPNGGDFNVLDFYTKTGVSGAESLWIYTGIEPSIGWLNLTGSLSAVMFTVQSLTEAQKKQALKNLGYIEIGGQLFEYRKKMGSVSVGIAAGDIALNGWISPTRFGELLVYVSGSPTLLASWDVVNEINF